MLPRIFKRSSLIQVCYYTMLCIFLLYTFPAQAQSTSFTSVNAQSMLVNIATNIPALMQMTTAIAYVMGMYFIIHGILQLKYYGEQRSMMSQEHSLKGPIIFMTVGALLLYLPSSVQVGMSTFWTDPNPYGYLQQQEEWTQFISDCFVIVQFIGVLSFIRGLVVLSSLAGHGGQQGALSKGIMQVIGGIFCINIYQFVQVIMATLGLTLS